MSALASAVAQLERDVSCGGEVVAGESTLSTAQAAALLAERNQLRALLFTASYGSVAGAKSPYAAWGEARALLGCSPTGGPLPKAKP